MSTYNPADAMAAVQRFAALPTGNEKQEAFYTVADQLAAARKHAGIPRDTFHLKVAASMLGALGADADFIEGYSRALAAAVRAII